MQYNKIRIISILTTIFFFSSLYLLPSLNAITLGEIKTDNGATRQGQVSAEDLKKLPDKDVRDVDRGESSVSRDIKSRVNNDISPRLVCLLSVMLPGGGHFYMNNDAKGMSFCLAAGAGYTVSGFFMVKTMLAERGTVAYKNYLLLAGFVFFITLIIHFVGIIEAYSDADEINKKNLFDSEKDDPYSINIEDEK